ncbi:MAG: adenylate kinase family protein [Candidatus Helarchaeota archaeon]
MSQHRLVIVISGTPGTGKTTVAQKLKEIYSAITVNLTDYAITNNLILEDDEERQTKVVNLNSLLPKLETLIQTEKGNIIIEGHYADIVPNRLISIGIILRTDPHILETRLKLKQFSVSKIQENLQSEILGACTAAALETYEREKIYEIDTSKISVNETIEQIQEYIETRPPSNVGKINWMRKLEENDELIRFF